MHSVLTAVMVIMYNTAIKKEEKRYFFKNNILFLHMGINTKMLHKTARERGEKNCQSVH